MADGRIDGHFVINKGGITHGIAEELGLSASDCKKMGSIWNEVINELNNEGNYTIENNGNNNGLTVQVGAVVKFSQDCWQRIVDLVNKTLDKMIEAEAPDQFHDNVNLGTSAINQFNESYPNAQSSTFCEDLAAFLSEYGNDSDKLAELKQNPNFADLVRYIEDFQAGKISIEELRQNAAKIDETGNNNLRCGERAEIVSNTLAQQGISSTVIGLMEIANMEIREDEDGKYPYLARPEHAFCVVGLDENADTSDPSTWGENAVIVDAWLGKTFSVKDGIEFYKEFFRYNDKTDENGNPRDYKMEFGTQEELWARLPQM